jgi:hypothetical protein
MRIIIAGSRTVTEAQVREALDHCPWLGFASTILSGAAKGADEFGEHWARAHSLLVERVPADWKSLGRRAGPARNKTMAENADGLIAIWDGESRGTLNMIELAKQYGLRICIYRTVANMVENEQAAGALANRWAAAEERAGILQYEAGMSRASAEKAAGAEQAAHTPAAL